MYFYNSPSFIIIILLLRVTETFSLTHLIGYFSYIFNLCIFFNAFFDINLSCLFHYLTYVNVLLILVFIQIYGCIMLMFYFFIGFKFMHLIFVQIYLCTNHIFYIE